MKEQQNMSSSVPESPPRLREALPLKTKNQPKGKDAEHRGMFTFSQDSISSIFEAGDVLHRNIIFRVPSKGLTQIGSRSFLQKMLLSLAL